MLCNRLCVTGFVAAVLSIVLDGGDAEARCGCRYRQGWRSNGGYVVGWQNNGYGYVNSTMQPNNNAVQTTDVNGNSTVVPVTADGSTIQTNNNYSVNRPTYANQPLPATQVVVPNQINPVPNNRPFPAGNPSPDVDNSVKNLTTSPIPGTSPSKAPEPPAAAVAPRH